MLTWNKLRAHADLLDRPIPEGKSLMMVATAYVQKWAPELVREDSKTVTVTLAGWNGLRSKLDGLNRKAIDLGLTIGVGYQVLRGLTQPDAIDPRKGYQKLEVAISGPSLRWEGWNFIGLISPYKKDDPTKARSVYVFQGYEVAEEALTWLKNRPIQCDHCRLKRHRVQTFLLSHEDGRLVEVGSDCIKDYLGHVYPVSLATLATELAHWGDWLEEDNPSSAKPDWALETFMAYMVEAVIKGGGVLSISRSPSIEDTASLAWREMERGSESEGLWKPSAESVALARETLSWARKSRRFYGPHLTLLQKDYIKKGDAKVVASIYRHSIGRVTRGGLHIHYLS